MRLKRVNGTQLKTVFMINTVPTHSHVDRYTYLYIFDNLLLYGIFT